MSMAFKQFDDEKTGRVYPSEQEPLTAKEWEAMRKEFKRVTPEQMEQSLQADGEWKDELPQVEFPSGRGWLVIGEPDINGVVIVRDESGEYRRVAKDAVKIIKTEADKLRDEQIENMANVSMGWGQVLGKSNATILFNSGCRMTRELTPDDITRIGKDFWHCPVQKDILDFAKAIAAYVRGEVEL